MRYEVVEQYDHVEIASRFKTKAEAQAQFAKATTKCGHRQWCADIALNDLHKGITVQRWKQ